MGEEINVEVEGAVELQKKMEQVVTDLRGMAFTQTMKKATLMIQRRAKLNLHPWRGPGTGGIDTGMLRASITPSIQKRGSTVMGVVGSNLDYAPCQELGARPHYVPAKYIGRWAELHGMGWRGIFITGKALRFLGRAVESEMKKIQNMFTKAVADIVKE